MCTAANHAHSPRPLSRARFRQAERGTARLTPAAEEVEEAGGRGHEAHAAPRAGGAAIGRDDGPRVGGRIEAVEVRNGVAWEWRGRV